MPARYPKYHSTRSSRPLVSFQEALLTGLAPDGGLYLPDFVPSLKGAPISGDDSFSVHGFHVLKEWLGAEVEESALHAILQEALNFDVPLVPLSGSWSGISILELFHGPTHSFKDFGARTMARLMGYFLEQRDEHLTILVATSGDTGSAVADGFAGQDRIQVALLYPEGQVSPVQERQLITRRPGVRALRVRGTFDDCQRMVKEAFLDPDLAGSGLSSANSINIGRLLPQMLYYFWAHRQAASPEVVFCIPSGNLGNLTGGLLAGQAGLPVRKYLAAHNANDFFPRHLTEGIDGFAPSVRTVSNAMDVGAPSNFERIRVLLSPDDLRRTLWGTSVSDETTRQTLKELFDETGYVADPHTAVGLEAARRYRAESGDRTPLIVLSTAHPAKFPETLRETLNINPALPERLASLWQQPVAVQAVDATAAALKEVILTPIWTSAPSF